MLSPLKAENSLRAIGVGCGRELDRSFPTVLIFLACASRSKCASRKNEPLPFSSGVT
jgi:hypothetical protein